jgi:uncharacterized membrane protein YphA (DoxX/SURF4 family)
MYIKNISGSVSTFINILLWILSIVIAYVLAVSCYQMLSGNDKAIIDILNKHGDKVLRYSVALLQGVGAVMILLPAMVVWGSACSIIAMIGVLAADMSSAGGIPAEPTLVLILSILLLVGRLKFPAYKLSQEGK